MLPLLLACAHPSSPVSRPAPAPTPVTVVAPAPDPRWVELNVAVDRDGDHAWQRLARLCDDIGARPAGSAAYLAATVWAENELRADGLTSARREPVTHPVWSRGAESLTLLSPLQRPLAVLGLGGTVGTPPIEAAVVVVHSFDELSPAVKGKIVLYNVPMEQGDPAVPHYGTAVAYRGQGASRAAAFGAVGVMVRSVTQRSLYTPHTGAMHYDEAQSKIPAVAVTTEDADQIDRLTARGTEVRVRLALGAAWRPDAVGANVVAEIRGSELPEEIVLISAHLDSWDVGCGAHDDGAGVVEVLGAMRAIAALGVPPRRTIRAVLYDNEEHGLSGGKAYAAAHGSEVHRVAMETDLGGGRPLSWSSDGTEAQQAWLAAALAPMGLPLDGKGGGADISTLEGVLQVGMRPDDSHYFDVHHTNADTVDKVDPVALRAGVGAVAGFAWLTANAP